MRSRKERLERGIRLLAEIDRKREETKSPHTLPESGAEAMLQYPMQFYRNVNGSYYACFPDVQGASAMGWTREDVTLMAIVSLEAKLNWLMEVSAILPAPSTPEPNEVAIRLPAFVENKCKLYEAMRRVGVGRAELARRLRWTRARVNRLLNLRVVSTQEDINFALEALQVEAKLD